MSISITTAKKRLEELGYDPIEALVEIAKNRNQIGDLRLKAALALLPYAYTALPVKSDITLRDGTGVMAIPAAADSELTWSQQVEEMKKRQLAAAAVDKVIAETTEATRH
jgi:hypothetical protein